MDSTYAVVLDVLRQASSQDPSVLKPAETKLREWETQPGFYAVLLNILSDFTMDVNVRFMAVLCLKNGVDRYWRKNAPNAISEQEKSTIRQGLLCSFEEPINQIAVQRAVLISKVARMDWPREWSNVFPVLLQGIESPNGMVQHRSLLTLHHVVKAVSSKRLAGDKRLFQEFTASIYAFILNLWNGFNETFVQNVVNNAADDVLLSSLEKALLTLRVVRKLTVFGFHKPHENRDCMSFLKILLEKTKVILQCHKQIKQKNHNLVEQCEKYIIHMTKMPLSILDIHPFSFVDLIEPTLEFTFYYLFTDEGIGFLFERFIIQCFSLIKNILLCAEYKAAKVPEMTRNQETLRAHHIKVAFFTPERLADMCRKLVGHYFILTPEELAMWEADPETFSNDETGDSWKYSLRPSIDTVFVTVFHEYRKTVTPVILDLLSTANGLVSPDDITGILKKDAIYNAVGLCAFDLYEEVDFDQWFTTTLLQELKIRDNNYRVIRRRVIILMGKWTSIKLSNDLRPLLYDCINNLLSPEEDIAIRLAAASTLRHAIDDFDFDSEQFKNYMLSAFNLLFSLLREVNECETKMQVLNVMTLLLERMGSIIQPHSDPLLQYLPFLWQESEEHNMLRCAIVSTMVQLVKVLVIQLGTDTTQHAIVYLLEDCLDLWLTTLEYSKSMTNEYMQLFNNMPTLLEYSTEILRQCLCICLVHLLLAPDLVLRTHGCQLMRTCAGIMNDLNNEGVVMLMRKVYQDEEYPTVMTMYLCILSRVVLSSHEIFIRTMNALAQSRNETEQATFGRIMNVWLDKMRNVSQLDHSQMVLERFGLVMLNILETLNDITAEGCLVDSLVIAEGRSPSDFDEDGDGYYETEHDQRKKALIVSDPIHTIALKDYLQSQLIELKRQVGEQQYQQLWQLVDADTISQLKDYILSTIPYIIKLFEDTAAIFNNILMKAFQSMPNQIEVVEKAIAAIPELICCFSSSYAKTIGWNRKSCRIDSNFYCSKCSPVVKEEFGDDIAVKNFWKVKGDDSLITSAFKKVLMLLSTETLPAFASHLNQFHSVSVTKIWIVLFEDQSDDVKRKVVDVVGDLVRFSQECDIISESVKMDILEIIFTNLLALTKKSLKFSNYQQQYRLLQILQEITLTKKGYIALEAMKILLYFIMIPTSKHSLIAVNACFKLAKKNDVTTIDIYKENKKELCEDFVTQESNYLLPFLVRKVVKMPAVTKLIQEMATMLDTEIADMLTCRYGYIFIQIFLDNLSKEEFKQCMKYLEKATGMSGPSLRKRNFRIILNKLLLNFHEKRENVLLALTLLAEEDTENKTTNIPDYLHPHFLGVLLYFDGKLMSKSSKKRNMLQSLADLLRFMGPNHIMPLRFKIIAMLQATNCDQHPELNVEVWDAFVRTCKIESLSPHLALIFVSILPLLDSCSRQVNDIFRYLIVENEENTKNYIPDLFFVSNDKIDHEVLIIIKRYTKALEKYNLKEKIKTFLKYLTHEATEVKIQALRQLKKYLEQNREELDIMILNYNGIDSVIVELVDILTTGCREKDEQLKLACGQLIGELGAIEPSHLPKRCSHDDHSFSFYIHEDSFIIGCLTELIKGLQSEYNPQNMDRYALAIQEILKEYEISPEGHSSRKYLWDEFSDTHKEVMLPLLSSRYVVSQPVLANNFPTPVYGSHLGTSFHSWLYNWTCSLIYALPEDKKNILTVCLPSMKHDKRILMYFLPHVLVLALLEGTDGIAGKSLTEIQTITTSFSKTRCLDQKVLNLRPIPAPGGLAKAQAITPEEMKQMQCTKVVFLLLDFLDRWLREWEWQKGQAGVSSENYKTIQAFQKRLCKLQLAKCNYHCGEYPRALMYLEDYITENKNCMEEHLPFLAEIYAQLDEPDGTKGATALQSSEPSVEQKILALEVSGKLADATTCYEQLMRPLKLHHVQYDELDGLVKKPEVAESKYWGVQIGKALLNFKEGKTEAFQTTLNNLLTQQLDLFSAASLEEGAYQHGYNYISKLHTLNECQQVQRLVSDILVKPNDTQYAENLTKKLTNDWNLRIKIIEPLLCLRRVSLNLAKKVIEDKLQQPVSYFDKLIGDCWLLSAKIARKICAQARLLYATYNDEISNVEAEVNILNYRRAIDAHKEWEKNRDTKGNDFQLYMINFFGKSLLYGTDYVYQSMPRLLSIWFDYGSRILEVTNLIIKEERRSVLLNMTRLIDSFLERLPPYVFLTAFSQLISRICHPQKEVYGELKLIIIKLLHHYPQQCLWMIISVIKSSYPVRSKRCAEILSDPRLKSSTLTKLIRDFTSLAEKLIELCNKEIPGDVTTSNVSSLLRSLPRLLAKGDFSEIMMPTFKLRKLILPNPDFSSTEHNPFPNQNIYITGIEDEINILTSLQRPRKITLRGSDGHKYTFMLKPKDDLRKDFRLMEFNDIVNHLLSREAESRQRRLNIRLYSVAPLNEECGLIEWVPNLIGLRPALMTIYKQKGSFMRTKELKEACCNIRDPLDKKRDIFLKKLMPRHPPSWLTARTAYIRTTAVMSMAGYILGLGDRHGENISLDSTCGDVVHVDFNCLFNKGTFRISCACTLRVLRHNANILMSIVTPFVYDPLVSWTRNMGAPPLNNHNPERTNDEAVDHIKNIELRLQGTVKSRHKTLTMPLSVDGQTNYLINEAISIDNLCQMYIGWGPYL
nr:unnamed protein product [Callosobruchus analis]